MPLSTSSLGSVSFKTQLVDTKEKIMLKGKVGWEISSIGLPGLRALNNYRVTLNNVYIKVTKTPLTFCYPLQNSLDVKQAYGKAFITLSTSQNQGWEICHPFPAK